MQAPTGGTVPRKKLQPNIAPPLSTRTSVRTGLDLSEWKAIEVFKRGDPGPLKERWNAQQGKPVSPLLHEFILHHFIEGKPLRPRSRPTTATKTAMIQTAYLIAKNLEPSAKETAIHKDLAKQFKLSTQRIEQIVYSLPKSPPHTP